MDKKLENKLYEKYPKLFRQKDLSMQETCMNWGICTGNGWYFLIDNLCNCIQNYIDTNNKSQVEIVQLKEKFGSMTFYVNGADELIHGMIWLAEAMSCVTCETCGTNTDIVHTRGWVRTLCKNCVNKE